MPEAAHIPDRLRAALPTISVGILTADLSAMGSEVALLERAGVSLLHFDVMDGCFCPQMTFGPPLVRAATTTMLKDVHLMVDHPLDKIAAYAEAGADLLTVHVEGERHPHRLLQAVGELTNRNDPARGILRGVALNPGTPLDVIEPLLDLADLILLLTVNPGWSGQKMAASTGRRMDRTRELIRRSGRPVLLCLDGGIKRENVGEAVRMGADIVVTGSAVFDGKDAAANARIMLDEVRRAGRVA